MSLGEGISVTLEGMNGSLGWSKLSVSDGERPWTLHIPASDYSFADLWGRKVTVAVRGMDLGKREADIHILVQECSLP